MRYFLAGFVMMFTVSVWAADASYNESVAAISYNPSRLGAYSHLKIAQKAVLKGGIDAQTNSADVNILTKGTVNVQDGPDCTDSNACHELGSVVSMAGEDGCANFSAHCGENDFAATLITDSDTLVHGGNVTYSNITLPEIVATGSDQESYDVNFPLIPGTTNTEIPGTNLNLSAGAFTMGANTKLFVKTLNATLTNAHLDIGTLVMNGSTFEVKGDNPTFKIGKTSITAGTKNCGNSCAFSWKTRIDNFGKKANVLAIK